MEQTHRTVQTDSKEYIACELFLFHRFPRLLLSARFSPRCTYAAGENAHP